MIPYSDGIETFPGGEFLKGRGANYTSQFGEDGLIAKAIENFGAINQWCFEVGASDGLFFSNTARLREQGWKTVLIEGEAEPYDKLRRLASPTVFTIPKRVNGRSLTMILRECGAPRDLDFGVIDVDGQDYWAWGGLEDFEPRLVLIEYSYKSNEEPEFIPAVDGPGQASFKAILRLGAEKDYLPLARTHCNILFCRSELLA